MEKPHELPRWSTGASCEHWDRFKRNLSKGRGPSVQDDAGHLEHGVYTPEAAARCGEWEAAERGAGVKSTG